MFMNISPELMRILSLLFVVFVGPALDDDVFLDPEGAPLSDAPVPA